MSEPRKIIMDASLAGDSFNFDPGQELVVGVDVSEEQAIAFCTEPADFPRAHAVGWDPWNPAAEGGDGGEGDGEGDGHDEEGDPGVDDDREHEDGEREGDGERDDGAGGEETATDKQVETRETATPKRPRRRVKPPEK